MQIDDGRVLGWLWDGLVVLAGAVAALALLILRGYRNRLETVEEKMAQAITKPEVETIVHRVEDEFKEEHNTILKAISEGHAETRSYIRDMFDAREGKWNGRNRRKN